MKKYFNPNESSLFVGIGMGRYTVRDRYGINYADDENEDKIENYYLITGGYRLLIKNFIYGEVTAQYEFPSFKSSISEIDDFKKINEFQIAVNIGAYIF